MKLTGKVVAVALDADKRIVTIKVNEATSAMYGDFKVESYLDLGQEVDITVVQHGA